MMITKPGLTSAYLAAYFYSQSSSDPSVLANWNSNPGGGGVTPADFSGVGDTFVVQSGHTMTAAGSWTVSGSGATVQVQDGSLVVNNGVTVPNLEVDSSGSVTVSADQTLEVTTFVTNGGPITVSGILKYDSTTAWTTNSAGGASLTINSGGTYQHNANGGTIPTATWNTGSTNLVTGITSATSFDGGLRQAFPNFVWNCTGQSSLLLWQGNLTMATNVTILSTGTGTNSFNGLNGNSVTNYGDLVISGGNIVLSGSSGINLYLGGNYLQTGGSFKSSSAGAFSTLTFKGGLESVQFTRSAGTFGDGDLTPVLESGKTMTLNTDFPVGSPRTFTVRGTLLCNGHNVTGPANAKFTLDAGGTLGITDPNGITTSGATGNIRVSSTRTFSTAGNYIYYGTAAQATGDGLPATVNNLTINNSGGGSVILNQSETVDGELEVSSGAQLDFNRKTVTAAAVLLSSSGALKMEVAQSGDSSKLTQSSGTLNFDGTLTVTTSDSLSSGSTYMLFNAGTTGSFAVTNLPHGNAHWDLSALNSAGTITFVNTAPVAKDLTNGVSQGNSATLLIIGGKNSPTDADGDALTVTDVTQPAEGDVTFTSSNVTYNANGSAGTYTYSYTVSDPFGATDTNTVTVIVTPFSSSGANIVPGSFSLTGGNNVQLQAFGLPGAIYRLEYTESLSAPIVWVDLPLSDVAAGTNGAVSFNYTHSEALPGSGFFRTKYVSGP